MPRGFRGITSIFALYLDVLNDGLSDPERLDYNQNDRLVHKAIEALARRLSASKRWFSRQDAQQIVDAFLPGRDFSRSLYQGLVSENLIMEFSFAGAEEGDADQDFAVFSYERYADHITVSQWIRDHLDGEDPDSAFTSDGVQEFLFDEDQFIPRGILEALSVQMPENTGREFLELAPDFADEMEIREAFLNSVLWRKLDSFSPATLEVLKRTNQ